MKFRKDIIVEWCGYCVDGDALILMHDFSTKKLKDIKIGEKILTFSESPIKHKRRFVESTVLKKYNLKKKKTVKIYNNNNSLYLTNEHKILISNPIKWETVEKAFSKNIPISFNVPFIDNILSYKIGMLLGLISSDGTNTIRNRTDTKYVHRDIAINQKLHKSIIEYLLKNLKIDYTTTNTDCCRYRILTKHYDILDEWYAHLEKDKNMMYGFLLGFIIGDGHFYEGQYIINQTENNHYKQLITILKKLDIKYNDIYVKIKSIWGNCWMHRLYIGKFQFPIYRLDCSKIHKFFNFNLNRASLQEVPKEKIYIDKKIKIKNVYDITTEHGSFIANGFIVHNCKAEINIKDGVVIDKKGDCYHLECYHLLNGFPMEFEGNIEEEDNDE